MPLINTSATAGMGNKFLCTSTMKQDNEGRKSVMTATGHVKNTVNTENQNLLASSERY